MIYYKIFTHGPICDVGSYAPRNYAKIRKDTKKEVVNIRQIREIDKNNPKDKAEDLEAEINKAGWYIRQENNGWRPVIIYLLITSFCPFCRFRKGF